MKTDAKHIHIQDRINENWLSILIVANTFIYIYIAGLLING